MRDDGLLRIDDAALRDGDLSAQDHHDAWGNLTRGHQSRAGAVRSRLAEAE